MIGCEEYELLLSVQLDGALSPQESHALEEHLATCPHCRALQAELTLMQKEVAGLSCEPPLGLTEKIMAQVRQEPRTVTPLTRPSSRRHWTRLLASAAVLVLVVLGASLNGLFSFGSPNAATESISTPGSAADADQAAPVQETDPETDTPDIKETQPAPPPPKEETAHGNISSGEPNPESKSTDVPKAATGYSSPSDIPEHNATMEDQAPASEPDPQTRSVTGAGGGSMAIGAQSIPLTQEEAQGRLVEYLAASAIAYDTLEYLGTCTGQDGYLFTVTYQNSETNTYWVSLADGTVSPIAGLEKTPGE